MTIAIVKGVASYGESIFMEYSGERIISDVRYRLFSHLMNADLNFFHNTSSGKLISRFTYDVGLLRASVSTALTGIAKDTMTLTFLVTLMFYQDWFLAIIAFFVFPAAVLPILYIGRKIRKISTSTQHEIGSFASLLSQIFQSARYVKAYTMQKYEKKRAKKIVEDLFNLEDILSPSDDLIIIIKDKINDTSLKLMKNLVIKDKVFCTIMTLKQLQFNILDHSLVPPHRILSEVEVESIKENYNITQDSQFPEISRFDPVAQAIGMRPGEVCEIIRGSK